ncbi:hypothetical protein GCM10025777_19350 [Membranihabitans marinus]
MVSQSLYGQAEYVDKVYPYLDAANSRWFYFSSASRPFGMVNLSPDMVIDGAWNSGYRYNEDSIRFFSHIHAWQMSGIPVMPTTGTFKGHKGPDAYGSKYSHDTEVVHPGYHKVDLLDYGITAELTSTTRVGMHRYTFNNKDEEGHVLLDLGTVLGPSGTKSGYAKVVSKSEIEGYALMEATSRRPKPTYVYFVIKLNRRAKTVSAWQSGDLLGKVKEFEGSDGGVYFTLKNVKKPLLMKVAISYTSVENARKNLKTELNHWDFDQVVASSRSEWNEKLGRIEVSGNTEKQQQRFYTDLWKALQGRRIISDVNGAYCDMTGDRPRIGQIPLDEKGQPKFNHYNSDSFWGAQWTITTLWQLLYPEIASEFTQSMLMMYGDGGLIPRGPSGGNYTYVMTGASSTPFMIGGYMKGIRDYDVSTMYAGLKKNAMPNGMMAKAGYEHKTWKGGGVEHYIEKGYVPYPLGPKRWAGHQDGAGQTLEYSFQDWCLAQLADNLGKKEDYQYFMNRSSNWKNIFDESIGWIRPKDGYGSWMEDYDIYEHQHGFVESNGAQATWYVPHDLAGLAHKMGGAQAAANKLNASFETASKLDFTAGKSHSAELNAINRRIPINYGNQPSIQTGFVFNYIQNPWLTQYWTRQVLDHAFADLSPERGFNGDEDQGLMGSLAVLMKIGLFEMHAGCAQRPFYDIGSPIFDKVVLHLSPEYYHGGSFEISTIGNSSDRVYVEDASLNGQSHKSAYIFHDELIKGGKLELKMSDLPNTSWGVDGVVSPSELLQK